MARRRLEKHEVELKNEAARRKADAKAAKATAKADAKAPKPPADPLIDYARRLCDIEAEANPSCTRAELYMWAVDARRMSGAVSQKCPDEARWLTVLDTVLGAENRPPLL